MKLKHLVFLFAILLVSASNAFALQCAEGRNVEGSSDDCWVTVRVASNETTLVSQGTVLVFDVNNTAHDADYGAFQVRVSSASADGVRVAGVAQTTIASGNTGMAIVRGKGYVGIKTTETVTSGNALFVSTSGDASLVTSNTINQLGFALETTAASGNGEDTSLAYITIV